MKIMGLIPARGGSKGIPGKNIKNFSGEPLIAHSIKTAQLISRIDRLILSTDDEKIAQVGREYNIEVPFIRPEILATDSADALSVFKHALEFVIGEGYHPDALLVLQPTSPLREAVDIEKAIDLFEGGGFDQVISLTPVRQHPYWMKRINEDNSIEPYIKEQGKPLRRQELPSLYIPNGAIYIYTTEFILNNLENPKVGSIIMEEWKSLDIDTPLDFYLAEKVMEEKFQAGLR